MFYLFRKQDNSYRVVTGSIGLLLAMERKVGDLIAYSDSTIPTEALITREQIDAAVESGVLEILPLKQM